MGLHPFSASPVAWSSSRTPLGHRSWLGFSQPLSQSARRGRTFPLSEEHSDWHSRIRKWMILLYHIHLGCSFFIYFFLRSLSSVITASVTQQLKGNSNQNSICQQWLWNLLQLKKKREMSWGWELNIKVFPAVNGQSYSTCGNDEQRSPCSHFLLLQRPHEHKGRLE